MKADVQATKARKFKDPKSYVAQDGREVLSGKDWDLRKFELLKRCHGQCEYMMAAMTQLGPAHIRCAREAADPHHIELRSRKRDDRLEKLQALCRHHHNVVDAQQREAIKSRNRCEHEELQSNQRSGQHESA